MSAEGRPKILVTEALEEDAMERLRAAGEARRLSDDEVERLAEHVADAEALVVRTRARVSAEVIAAAKRLKVIGRAGAGLDNVDVEAARRAGVRVVYAPDAATEAVADLTVGLMLAALRRIPQGDAEVRRGRFEEGRRAPLARETRRLTLGIVGMGRIGRAVAWRCHWGFAMPVLYHDIRRVGHLDVNARPVSLEALLREVDVVSLHVPLTDVTRRMINARTLALMKPNSILINTARGGVVDHEALAAALKTGRPARAALDVTDPEPLPPGHPLLQSDEVLFTPHVGARTEEGQRRMNDVVEDVIAVLQGRAPRHPAWSDGVLLPD